MLKYTDYNISTLRPYINWIYFFFAWGLSGKPQEAKDKMRAEAEQMLDRLEKRYKTHAAFGLFDANSDGDDIPAMCACLCCANSILLGRANLTFRSPTSYVRNLRA